MKRPAAEKGVVLVTILVVMALCVTVIVAMTTASERSTRATLGDLEAGQARALLTAGEAGALSALLLDLANPPEADGLSEAWARLAQSDVSISGGSFSLEIWDEAARFNLNTLTADTAWSRQMIGNIVAVTGLNPEVATRIAAALKGGKPLLQIEDLASRAGLAAGEIAALAPFATATPDLSGGVNINTASLALLSALLPDPGSVDIIVTERKTRLITPDTLQRLGLVLPEGLTLRSDVFGLKIGVSSGASQLTAFSTIHRWRDPKGRAHAVVSARKFGRL